MHILSYYLILSDCVLGLWGDFMDSEPWYSLMFRPKAGKSTVIPPKDALDGIDPLINLSHMLQLRCQDTQGS